MSAQAIRFLLCTLIALALPGCGKRRSSNSVASDIEQRFMVLDEARLIDVSLPIGVTAYDISSNSQQTIARYEASFTLEMLHDFYAFDMERLGWHELTKFTATDHQALFLFEKPTKWCIISVEYMTHERSRVLLAIGPKEQNLEAPNEL